MIEQKFSIFTLNCWGIPLIASDRSIRMKAIAKELSSGKYDLVSLQEIWSENDFLLIKEEARDVLPYSHYFHCGVIGSGLCVFSKFPIQDAFFHQWPLNGYIHKIHHADWFGGKGIGLCQIQANGIIVHFYNAHLHAQYSRKKDQYLAHRVMQAFETSQFIGLTSSNADLIILGGDLNSEPNDLTCKLIRDYSNLKTSDSLSNGTNECKSNSYTPKEIARKDPEGKIIDYIMYKSGPCCNAELEEYCLPLPNRVPDQNFSYSDHEAIKAIIRLRKNPEISLSTINLNDKQLIQQDLEESINIYNRGLKQLKNDKWIYYCFSLIFLILVLVLSGIQFLQNNMFYNVLIAIPLIAIFCYTLIMATLWNRIEMNALRAGLNALNINLDNLLKLNT